MPGIAPFEVVVVNLYPFAAAQFYDFPRYVTHIDDGAIAAVGALYDELGIARRGARPHELVGLALPDAPRHSPCSA